VTATSDTLLELSPRQRDIVAAALRILEREGPKALTIRGVAAELGIRGPSLYKHVKDKGVIEGLLQRHAMIEFGRAVGAAGSDAHSVAHAYRGWARANPHLYELAARRPVRRDIVAETEAFAAAPLVAAVGGDATLARVFLGLAHGLIDLELNDHFPPGADVDLAWNTGVDALVAASRARRRQPR
jgi:AcrR family transcriptional regulator